MTAGHSDPVDLALLEQLPACKRYFEKVRAWEATTVAGLLRLDAGDDLIEAARELASELRERMISP